MAKAMQVVVWWPSALPVKQAVIRRALSEDGVGGDARIPKEQQDFLDQNEGHYIVSMTGFPPQYSRMIKSRPLMQGTSLNFNKRRPIYPDNIEVYLVDGTVTVLSYFPKDDPITLRDKELEFISQVLDVQVKRKFRLRDMVYAGQLML